MLHIQDLNQFYGESHTLWDIDFDIPEGSCVCLMGRNGVGKTTLLRTIMGLVKARSGELRFDGNELLTKPAEARSRLGIGFRSSTFRVNSPSRVRFLRSSSATKSPVQFQRFS